MNLYEFVDYILDEEDGYDTVLNIIKYPDTALDVMSELFEESYQSTSVDLGKFGDHAL